MITECLRSMHWMMEAEGKDNHEITRLNNILHEITLDLFYRSSIQISDRKRIDLLVGLPFFLNSSDFRRLRLGMNRRSCRGCGLSMGDLKDLRIQKGSICSWGCSRP